MQRTSTLVVVVGIFAMVGIVLLFGFSLKVSGPSARSGYLIYTDVDDARGLEKGAEVARAGVPVGVVDSVLLAADGSNKVRVAMRIFEKATVRKDALATIQLKSFLGTYFVHLSHGGETTARVQEGGILESEEVVDINAVMNVIGKLGGETGNLISSINENQQRFFDKIDTIIDENRENLKTVTEALAEAAPKIEEFLESVGEITASLNEGKGTLGKLLKEDELYESVRVSAANLRDISNRIKSSEGTLGKLIYDDEMAAQLAETAENVRDASASIKDFLDSSANDLRELIATLKDAGPSIRESLENLRQVSRKINEGEGTLGKLINDPELYDEARRAISQIRKTFEEGEEQSVLRTFLGVFFGSMI